METVSCYPTDITNLLVLKLVSGCVINSVNAILVFKRIVYYFVFLIRQQILPVIMSYVYYSIEFILLKTKFEHEVTVYYTIINQK